MLRSQSVNPSRQDRIWEAQDLSHMCATSPQVLHQAVLKVDEKGTEAAAATTIEIMPMSLPDTVRLDRPFLVFIVEGNTKSFLFMGKITNPTEQ